MLQSLDTIKSLVEQAVCKAIVEGFAYTVVGFEDDGSLIARIDHHQGSYWITL